MSYERRRFLQAAALAAVTAGAGCSTGSDDENTTAADGGGETPATSPTATPGGDTSGGETGDGTPDAAQFDFGGWLSDVGNYDGTAEDWRGQGSVSVDVGVSANDGPYGFGPPAVWVDSGTEVTWEWTGDGSHNVVAESGGDFRSGDATSDGSTTFSHTFEDAGTVTYFCNPHEGLGMKGAVVVGDVDASGGTTATDSGSAYDFATAAFDAYWYSLYNMSTNIAMSANGVLFPHNEQQRETFNKRVKAIGKHADVDGPPINNPNLNMAPFTEGDPHFTQRPVFEDDTGRPNAETLAWDESKSSGVVSPSSLGWTHLKGVTWAKNFQNHFDLLPGDVAPKFRAQVLTTLAQIGVKAALVEGKLRKNEDNMLLVSEFAPKKGEVVDGTPRLGHHSAMLWFMSDLVSLAKGGWFGYENPEPLIPAKKLQMMADGVAKTTMNAFSPDSVLDAGTTRDVGELLGGVGWYGTHAGKDRLAGNAADYADGLAERIEENLGGNGKVENGADNQAATQGVVAQGLTWASQIDGVDHTETADEVVGYMLDELWDADAGTFASSKGADTYTITARDAGDITGGINAADAVLGRSESRDVFARFFNQTFNRGHLQRAERPPSHSDDAEHALPLPPKAGGDHGQAAVYNAAVEYDTGGDEWTVTDDRFRTADALYLANQDIWIGNWAGDFFEGRGVPGQNDAPSN